MKVYRAEFRRESSHQAVYAIVTLLHVRAEDTGQARRLAAQVFEQIYGAVPARIGFALAGVEELA